MLPVPWQCGHCEVGAFEHAGAQALARHFEEAEVADAADLNAGAVEAKRFLQPALDGAVVALLLHVDEVDDDEAGEVAQLQLAGDLVGSLEVRVVRGLLDGELTRRLAGVHVDGDERFRLVDDEIAARFQRHLR